MAKMTKGRLTKEIKSDITRAVKRELSKLMTPIKEREHELALEILKSEAGEHWERLNKMPPEFISRTNTLRFGITNDEHNELVELTENKSHIYYTQSLDLDNYYPGSAHVSRSLSLLTTDQKHAVKGVIVERILTEQKQTKAIEELKSLLAGAKSIQELIKLWPEVEDYLPEKVELPKALPTVQTNTLNSLLPVEESKAA